MPCPWVFRGCQPDKIPLSAPDLDFSEAQVKITQRFASRRYNIFLMRAQIRRVVLLMALMEALRVGVPQLVFAGKKDQYPAPGEDDFGIAYWVGYFISYIYLCVFMVVWTPLFSWWVPKDIPSDSCTGKVLNKSVAVIKAFDMAILPLGIVLSLAQYVYYMLLNVVHPNSSGPLFRKPANDHTAWAARILMFCGVKLALVFGYGAFEILEQSGLARVKTMEYLIIVV
ncbi:MAG: hypothetical protein M1823_006858, partial [Watsoniomyces obsoletus]